MLLRKNLLTIKQKYLGGLLLLTAISIICVAFSMAGADDFDMARKEILLRRIGHELLLQSGDSVSRVLPVKKMADNEYQISFEKAFSFRPDSLVNTTQRLLANDPLESDYVVNVINCADASVAYGYAISKEKKDNIIACIGRRQPAGCYLLNIKFGPAGIITTKNVALLGGLVLLALVGGFLFWSPKPQRVLPENESALAEEVSSGFENPSEYIFSLGAIVFDAEKRTLVIGSTTTELTKMESRVLRMFAAAPNEAIERSRLQKEIWEDDGVIVGRSLDMFISKLRKKLEADPSLKIAVIRGKGYRLEISS